MTPLFAGRILAFTFFICISIYLIRAARKNASLASAYMAGVQGGFAVFCLVELIKGVLR